MLKNISSILFRIICKRVEGFLSFTDMKSSDYLLGIIDVEKRDINQALIRIWLILQDLEKSFSTQRTIVEAQKANEAESLELQEFLQAEKVTLTDSLKDMEQEVSILSHYAVREQFFFF